MKLPRNLDGLVDTGRHGLEGLVDGGRKSARRLYADGRGWIEDHLPDAADVRRAAKQGRSRAEHVVGGSRDRAGDAAKRGLDRSEDAGRAALRRAGDDDRLRAPVRWIEARLPEPGRNSSVLWPSVLAAAGAGVAFWWWTSWARGRAEAAERAALDAAGGAAGAARPEQVMAHAPEPSDAPVETPDPSAAKLSPPAEDIMAHTPPPSHGTPAAAAKPRAKATGGKATADEARLLASAAAAGLAGGVGDVAPAAAVKSLDESLAVQGATRSPVGGHST